MSAALRLVLHIVICLPMTDMFAIFMVVEETGAPYSQLECVEVCVQKKVIYRCQCQQVTLPLLPDWPICGRNVCNLSDLHCYEVSLVDFTSYLDSRKGDTGCWMTISNVYFLCL